MIKFPIKPLISVIAVIVGVVCLVMCVVPHLPSPAATVKQYVSAVNKMDSAAMNKLCISASDMFSQSGLLNFGVDSDSYTSVGSYDTLEEAIEESSLGISLPDEADEIIGLKFIGAEVENSMSLNLQSLGGKNYNAVQVNALIEITYTADDTDEHHKLYKTAHLGLMKNGSSYLIAY